MKRKSGGGMRKFFAENVEKVLLGMALLLGLILIYFGFSSRRGIEPDKSPEALAQQVDQTAKHIESSQWAHDYEAERDLDQQLLERANETLRQVPAESYVSLQVMKPPYHAPRKTRTDPELWGPTDLHARAGYGMISRRSWGRPRGGGSWFAQSGPEGQPGDEENIGRPIPDSMMMDSRESGMRQGADDRSKVEGDYFVVVTGLVPFRKQVEEYLERFKSAEDFRPERDFPNYIEWNLERADVTSSLEKPAWKPHARYVTLTREFRSWMMENVQERREAVDPMCTVVPQITSPLPPLVTQDLEEIARHPKAPTMEDFFRRMRQQERERERAEMDGMPRGGESRARRDGGMPRDGGPEMQVPMPFDRGMPGGSPGRGGRRGRRGGDGDRGPGGDVGAPTESAITRFPGFLESLDAKFVPENLMFRYFDFEVELGKSYQYRLQLVVEDANSPKDIAADPVASALSDEVSRRLQKRTRSFRRNTEFSPPSNPVRLVEGKRLLAGKVTPVRSLPVPNSDVTYVRTGDDAAAKMIAVEFDQKRAADLPIEITLLPGSVGYSKGKIEPVLRWKRWLDPEENHVFRINDVVLDIRGGAPLGVVDLTSPGEVMVWDSANDQLVLLDEIEDSRDYTTYIFPKEEMNDGSEGYRNGDFGGNERRGRGARGDRGEGGRNGGRDGGGDRNRRSRAGGDRAPR